MKYSRARKTIDSTPLDAEIIRKTVRSLFRRRNDYSVETMDELPGELRRFGVITVRDLRLLMKRHRRSLLMDENVHMNRAEVLWLLCDTGSAGIDTHAGKSWYAIPGLVRQAMELEFGEDAAVHVTEQQV